MYPHVMVTTHFIHSFHTSERLSDQKISFNKEPIPYSLQKHPVRNHLGVALNSTPQETVNNYIEHEFERELQTLTSRLTLLSKKVSFPCKKFKDKG